MDLTYLGMGNEAAKVGSALLFIAASTNAMDVYSALNSSPWTAESFGGDPEKSKACREYVYHSIGVTAFYCTVSAVLAKNVWPLVGWAIASGYMYWLYMRALGRAEKRGSTTWEGTSQQPAAPAHVNGFGYQ